MLKRSDLIWGQRGRKEAREEKLDQQGPEAGAGGKMENLKRDRLRPGVEMEETVAQGPAGQNQKEPETSGQREGDHCH